MTEKNRPTSERGRLELLDGLRFVAAVSVVAFHFTSRKSAAWPGGWVPQELSPVGRWAGYGQLGVPLFFVISGFVLLMTAWGRSLPSFVASRVGRLFPAYWAAVAISLVIVFVLWPEGWPSMNVHVDHSDGLLNATMLQGPLGSPDLDGPYWTLWYELRFYFLIALFMLVGITRARVLAFATLWPIAGAMASHAGSTLLTTLLMPDYACYFAGGMLLYLVYRDGHDRGLWLLICLQCVIALGTWVTAYQTDQGAGVTFGRSPLLLGLGIVACFGLVALVTLTPWAGRRYRWLTSLGALTYPLYLVHENLGWYLIHVLQSRIGPWPAVLVAGLAALVAAVSLHQLVEKPFGPRLRRMTSDMLRGPQNGTAEAEAAVSPRAPSVRDTTEAGVHRAPTHRVAHAAVPVPRAVRRHERPESPGPWQDVPQGTREIPVPGSRVPARSSAALPADQPLG